MKIQLKQMCLVFFIALAGCTLRNQISYLKLPALVSDNMVLQQNTIVNVWGWTNPGQKVFVKTGWNAVIYKTRADKTGRFNVRVETIEAGGPYTLSINADTLIELKNIMLGEVWVCSGQSNMEFRLNSEKSAKVEIPVANYPRIRLFTVERRIARSPVDDCNGKWQECSPETVSEFSAVAYFFGKKLYENLNVPIGLIHASWGGTPSEAWTSKEALEKFKNFEPVLASLYSDENMHKSQAEVDKLTDSIETANTNAFDFANTDNLGKREHWMNPEFNDNEWPEIKNPSEWSTHPEIGILEGVMWMRKTIKIPSGWAGKDLILKLGPIDEMDETYCNGELVGASDSISNWNKPRVYLVPGRIITGNFVTVAVRALNTVTEGGFIGKPKEMGLSLKNSIDKQTISLTGNWRYKIAYRIISLPPISNPSTPTYLFNGMIHPILPMVIKGAIWYQGESNVGRADEYQEIFPAMIQDWRNLWGIGNFPFYYVQIAPYDYGKKNIGVELREAQLLSLKKVSNSGMVVTLDIGNPKNIHPTNKNDVGYRLALWALNKDYGFKLIPSGPLYKNIDTVADSIKVNFDYASNGLFCKGDQLTNFEISGNDIIFHKAKARIEGNSVMVWNDSINSPVEVRFGWSNTAEPNLFNTEGLPASSFSSVFTQGKAN